MKDRPKLVRMSHDDAWLMNIPDDVKRDIVARLRACRREVYPKYLAFRSYVADPKSIQQLPRAEADAVSSLLVRIANAAAVWVCTHCEHVIALIDPPAGGDARTFLGNLLKVAAQEYPTCPHCGFDGWLFLKPSFLVSGLPMSAMTRSSTCNS